MPSSPTASPPWAVSRGWRFGTDAPSDTSNDSESCCCCLTAVEELQGHLRDCLSLYAALFEYSDISLAAAQVLPAVSPRVASHSDGRGTSVSPAAVPEPAAARGLACPVFNDDALADQSERHLDTNTAATILFLHPKANFDTDGAALLGVAVSFNYWRGFQRVAERRYSGVAGDAHQDAMALRDWKVTLSMMLEKAEWHPVSRPVVGAVVPTEELNGEYGVEILDAAGKEEIDAAADQTGYESLMALLVNTYF